MQSLIALLCFFSLVGQAAPLGGKDYTEYGKKWTLRSVWPDPKTEPGSGFHLGGANTDETLQKLKSINGISIEELEKRMRPDGYSKFGFLGKGEHLIPVLRKDNTYVVEKKKSSHRAIALALAMMADIGQKEAGQFADKAVHFTYRGQRYEYLVRINGGYQNNPFSKTKEFSGADDEATTSGSGIITLRNLTTSHELAWSTMMPFLIQRYGFYEGEGTTFRVAPEKVFEIMPFLDDAAQKN